MPNISLDTFKEQETTNYVCDQNSQRTTNRTSKPIATAIGQAVQRCQLEKINNRYSTTICRSNHCYEFQDTTNNSCFE
eukprot:6490294-Amphidinium_carterae.2